MVLGGYGLQHSLGQLHVSVLELVVIIARTDQQGLKRGLQISLPGGIVDRVNKLVETSALAVGEDPRHRIAPGGVDTHLLWSGHFGCCGLKSVQKLSGCYREGNRLLTGGKSCCFQVWRVEKF